MACRWRFITCAVALIFLLGQASLFYSKVQEFSCWKAQTAALADLPGPISCVGGYLCFLKSQKPSGQSYPSLWVGLVGF